MVGSMPTDSDAANDSGGQGTSAAAPAAPSISLPKGGGAIRGIGEKFAANPVTGTGSMTVPIATSPGPLRLRPAAFALLRLRRRQRAVRLRLEPLASRPSPARPTRACPGTGTPRSRTSSSSPAPKTWCRCCQEGRRRQLGPRTTWHAHRGRHVTTASAATARASRGCSPASSAGPTSPIADDVHWRSISKDNITTFYGKDREQPHRRSGRSQPHLQLADLREPRRQGQCRRLRVQAGGRRRRRSDPGPRAQPRRPRRPRRTANRYLKRIRYGNRVAAAGQRRTTPALPDRRHQTRRRRLDVRSRLRLRRARRRRAAASDDPARAMRPGRRNDPFSSYRAGFEVRTYRLCQRVLMFHHFPG